MKKLLSLISTVSISVSVATTVVACGDRAKFSFEGSGDASIEVGEKDKEFFTFASENVEIDAEKMADFLKQINEWRKDVTEFNEEEESYQTTLTSSDETVASTEVGENTWAFFTTLKEGKTKLEYTSAFNYKGEKIYELNLTVNLTVTAKTEKPSFLFNF